ncbi:M56 family metallopeptidase [Gordonia shandongensis]|uniref:M56 family metallopeptidase n=1 Tax=Gordonia shandongensis TaxID=376351 RepID=UPI000409049A|nr:M56 family metallopeptidase [Gordonia shandongensis]
MTTPLLPLLLIATLVVAAVAGPWLMRTAAPVLASRPRAAVALLAGGVGLWLVAFMSAGPLLAWTATGRTDESATGLCRRCLVASNPWAAPVYDLGLPTVAVLWGPGLIVVGAVAVALWRAAAASVSAERTAADVRASARRVDLLGYRVLLLPDERRRAFALPARRGGIVVTTGALDALAPDELAAVLAHEDAHLTQRHHLIVGVAHHLGRTLRPIPLIREAATAIPQYLEIAADDAARTRVGTRALVAALLRLDAGGPDPVGTPTTPAPLALHAVGPHRIGVLVGHERGTHRRASPLTATAQSALLVAFSAAALLPWVTAVSNACV